MQCLIGQLFLKHERWFWKRQNIYSARVYRSIFPGKAGGGLEGY